jgi:peptide/nickel transport system permease protein
MSSKIKIWQFLLLLYTTLIIFRLEYLINLAELYFEFVRLLIKQEPNISRQIDFRFIDALISLVLIILLPIVLISVKKIRQLILNPLNLSETVIILLVVCFIFAPIITRQNPNFQKNISVTKLLPPLSSVKYIELKNPVSMNETEIEKFVWQKNSIIPESYNDAVIFIDSLKESLSKSPESSVKNTNSPLVKYYQNGIVKNISLEKLIEKNDYPSIKERYFLFGSDEFGRDIFTRIVYGSRISLLIGFGSVLLSLIIGISFAFTASQKGSFIDLMLSRLTDLFLAFPAIFLVILILALFGSNLISVIIVLGLSGWMSLFKLVKTEIASIKKKEYFISAELIGLKNKNLLIREILPVIIAPVIVNMIFQFSNVILAESALSYLGLGTGNSYPSWGAMIEAGQEYITKSWWMIFIPGFILIVTLLSINSIGRKINRFYNPKILV